MSFLDDLKKEAEQVKQRETDTRSAEQQQRDLIVGAVRPHLKKLYDYLKDTCDQLTVVDPDIHMSYDVRGFGTLGPLRQGEYRVTAEDPASLDKFTLFFACTRPDAIRFQVDGKETAVSQKEYMWSCNLRFTSKVTGDGAGVFNMESYIPVTMEFEADLEDVKVHLVIRNLDTLGTNKMVFEPDMLDEEFMEELAKCIVRKDNRFQELSGNTVSKEIRMRLQQQLEHDKLKRDLEATTSAAESPSANKPKKKKKKGLLRSIFGN
jgi:hypothetical protein